MMLRKLTCRALIVSLLALSAQTAGAGMIGAERATAPDSPRARVLATLERSEVAAQLQVQGIDPADARQRVAALSDQEVAQLSTQIDSAPAGADAGVVIAVVAIAAAVWYFVFRR